MVQFLEHRVRREKSMIKVRHEILDRTFHDLQSHPTPSLERLVEGLASLDGDVREESRKSLVAHGTAAIKPLIALLPSADAQTRWEVVKALGQIHHPDAAPALASCLADEHRDVRWVAAESLITIGHDALEPVLEELIAHADSIWVRKEASHILHALGGETPALAPVIKALAGMAPLFEVPVAAFDALKGLRDR